MSKTVSKFAFTAGFVLAMAFTFSCSGDDEGGGDPSSSSMGNDGGVSSSAVQCLDADSGTFTDSRDNKEYKYVTICSQTWFAENLDYEVEGSKCYDNDPANCDIYGRLYDWSTAMGVCPSGWHLPNEAEWTALEDFAGGSGIAGKKLKATSGWNDVGNGTDQYGFSALPGGYGYSNGSFLHVGAHGSWWSVNEGNSDRAYHRDMSNYSGVDAGWGINLKSDLRSVRCVQD
jgi:uncharacterized protein (TIGR02145 family)